MTERKVLNKYFPPDYDPSKIPRKPKGHCNRSFNIRTMAPFNMRCDVCRVYIYKARKFNSRVSVAEGITYLGLRQYRFKIRCPSCCNEITWRSDIESTDYVLESGATRNFEALRTAEKLEAEKEAARQEELESNPMKALEERTAQSRNEMEILEALANMQEMRKSEAEMGINDKLIEMHSTSEELDKIREEADEIAYVESLLEEQRKLKKCESSDSDEEDKSRQDHSSASIASALPVPRKQSLLEKLRSKNSHHSDSSDKWHGIVQKRKNPDVQETSQPTTSATEPHAKVANTGCGLIDYSDSDSSSN